MLEFDVVETKKIRVYRNMDSRYQLGDFYAKLHLLFPRET